MKNPALNWGKNHKPQTKDGTTQGARMSAATGKLRREVRELLKEDLPAH